MYEQVFNFNSRPFTSTPYVKHYFPASAMNQAFGQASICIERASGPVVAIGDIGTGKSLLLAKLESEYQAKLQVVNLVCSSVNSRREFLQNILFEIGKPFNMDSEAELRFAVIQAVQPAGASPNVLLLLIDDAEMLTADVFDELRVLSNIVVDGTPQVRLVLAGRKSLEERLADPAHASFSQRIASRVFLSNLTRDETAAYVVEHIDRVGGNGQIMFPGETSAKLHELTDGCPRLINQVCDFGLILAGTRGVATVSPSLIEEAWNDVQALPMGSASLHTESATQSVGAAEDNDWTLIEFGQLDDDAPEPADATVYDFENSSPVDELQTGYSAQEGATADEAQPLETLHSKIESSNVRTEIDSELGIDLGSLQAMQDAAAARQAAELQTDSAVSSEDLEQEVEATSPDIEPEEAPSSNDAARVAMEQQLAAVFGTSLPSPTTEEVEASETSSELVAPAVPEATGFVSADSYQPLAAEEVPEHDEPDTTNSIAGVAAGSAFAAGAFAAAINSFTPGAPETPESPQTEGGFKPATSALGEQAASIDEAVASNQPGVQSEPTAPAGTPVSASQSADSFTPAFLVDDADGFVPATQPIDSTTESDNSVAEQLTEDASNESAIQSYEIAADSGAVPPVADDPFGESFASEASIPNRPTSEIIEQNQNALKICSSDLEHVQPTHAPTPDEIIHVSPNQSAEAGVPDAEVPAGESWMSTSASEANEAP